MSDHQQTTGDTPAPHVETLRMELSRLRLLHQQYEAASAQCLRDHHANLGAAKAVEALMADLSARIRQAAPIVPVEDAPVPPPTPTAKED